MEAPFLGRLILPLAFNFTPFYGTKVFTARRAVHRRAEIGNLSMIDVKSTALFIDLLTIGNSLADETFRTKRTKPDMRLLLARCDQIETSSLT